MVPETWRERLAFVAITGREEGLDCSIRDLEIAIDEERATATGKDARALRRILVSLSEI